MASTRFNDDPCRISKQLQQSTDPGRWILNVPGNGSNPDYIADPHIRLQMWGGNLMTNSINLESELRGVGKPMSRDCLANNQYQQYNVKSVPIESSQNSILSTEQSRTILPAWTARDLEQNNWYSLPLNPQTNTCMSFQNNISTRILEKDYFVQQMPKESNKRDFLPLPVNFGENEQRENQ
jgi:hypothetical protein